MSTRPKNEASDIYPAPIVPRCRAMGEMRMVHTFGRRPRRYLKFCACFQRWTNCWSAIFRAANCIGWIEMVGGFLQVFRREVKSIKSLFQRNVVECRDTRSWEGMLEGGEKDRELQVRSGADGNRRGEEESGNKEPGPGRKGIIRDWPWRPRVYLSTLPAPVFPPRAGATRRGLTRWGIAPVAKMGVE